MNNQFLKYYNFLHDPFASDADEFSFFAANRRFALDKLHASSKNLTLIVGEEGSGKTVLKNMFIAGLAANSKIISLMAQNNNLLDLLAAKLGCEQNILSIIAELPKYKNGYLIIDDAHNLNSEELTHLLQFSAIIKVVIWAQISVLEHKIFNGSNCELIKLPPCTDVQVKQYLAQKLQDAGGDVSLLNEPQMARIFLLSKGIFSRINLAAKQILSENITSNNDPKFKINKGLALVLGILVVIGVSALVFMPLLKSKNVENPPIATTAEPQLEPAIIVPEQISNNLLDEPTDFFDQTNLEQLSDLEAQIPQEETEPISEVTAVLPEPEVIKAVTAPKPKTILRNNNEPPKKYVSSVQADVPTKVLLDPNKKRNEPKTKVMTSEKSNNGNLANWYRQQNAKSYCLQIVAGTSEAGIKKLLAEYGAGYNYFKKNVNGKTFFVLTFGNFASRDQANNAINNLPSNIQKNKPFAISFAAIHKDLID